jgi:hypothetical protein
VRLLTPHWDALLTGLASALAGVLSDFSRWKTPFRPKFGDNPKD